VSILLQLQTFLFEENVPQDYGNENYQRKTHWTAVKRAKDIALAFRCSRCTHTASNPWPPLRDAVIARVSSGAGAKKYVAPVKRGVLFMKSHFADVSKNGLVVTNESLAWAGELAFLCQRRSKKNHRNFLTATHPPKTSTLLKVRLAERFFFLSAKNFKGKRTTNRVIVL